MKTRVTMTEDQLWHLFVTMDGICAAGSENETDEEVTIMLARALHARGITSHASEMWLLGNRFGDEER